MMFSPEIRHEVETVAAKLGVEAATLLAVVEVESGGRLFAVVEGRREPLIRFEGHYFDRRLEAGSLALARRQGLAAPDAGKVANPRTQEGRWKLLAKAVAIDRKAAYESVSWGAGQVMGSHWAWLGYASVDALVAEARDGEVGQVRLMTRYIDRAGLVRALAAHDWHAFARGYNGPAYRKNRYPEKLADAYRRHAAARPKATAVALPIPARAKPGPGRRAVWIGWLKRLFA